MNITHNKNTTTDFDNILDNNEKILWSDRPQFIPYLLSGFLQASFLLFFFVVWWISCQYATTENGEPPGTFFTYLPLLMLLWSASSRFFSYFKTKYAFTNKGVLICSGFISTEVKSIDYSKILEIDVNLTWADKLSGTGTIRFYTGNTETDEGTTTKLYDSLEAIANPYEALKAMRAAIS
ncbi:MAG TPA: PH domain-containing protein [Chitinophagales bacterium]|nr:PH domain-containing protein [Chitinophagales bacterium]